MSPAEPMLDARYDTISFKVVNDLLPHDSFTNLYDVRCQGNRAVAFKIHFTVLLVDGSDDRFFVAKWDYTVIQGVFPYHVNRHCDLKLAVFQYLDGYLIWPTGRVGLDFLNCLYDVLMARGRIQDQYQSSAELA